MPHISTAKPIKMFIFDNSEHFSSLDQWEGQGYVIPRFKMNDKILLQSIHIEKTALSDVFEYMMVNNGFRIEDLTQLALCSKGLYQRICKLFKENKKKKSPAYYLRPSGRVLVQRTLDCAVGIENLKLRVSDLPKHYGLSFAAIRQGYTSNPHSPECYVRSDAFYYPKTMGQDPTRYLLLNDIDPAVISRFPNLKSLLVQIGDSQTLFKINQNYTEIPFLTSLILGSQQCPNYFGESSKGFFENHEVNGVKGAYPQLLQECLPKMQNLKNLTFADDEMLPFSLDHLPQNCFPYLEHLSIRSAHASPQLIQQLLKTAPRLKSLFIQSRHDKPIDIQDVFIGLPANFCTRLEAITVQRLDINVPSSMNIPESDHILSKIAPKLKQIGYMPFFPS